MSVIGTVPSHGRFRRRIVVRAEWEETCRAGPEERACQGAEVRGARYVQSRSREGPEINDIGIRVGRGGYEDGMLGREC